MSIIVSTREVDSRNLAAVRRLVSPGGVGAVWRQALDKVWEFLRARPGLRTDGHNVFLYHPPAGPGGPMEVDFGVEVTRAFEPAGEVHSAATPAGTVALAVHLGAYSRLSETYDAIHAWRRANNREYAGPSWEIYGDWSDDPAKLETTIVFLLK